MAIINLKNIGSEDTDDIKLDKVNYNFDQLVSNGGGPQGPVGNIGQTGFQGVNGYQGPFGTKGDQGYQGPQGTSGGDVWLVLQGNLGTNLTSDVIFPKHDAINFVDPPIVSVGFKESDPEYTDVNTYADFNTAPYQFIINRHPSRVSNLAFKTNNTNNLFMHTIEWDNTLSLSKMKMGFSGSGLSRVEFVASEHRYADVTGAALVTIDANHITSNIPAEFNNDLTIKGNLTIETGNPDVNKIAVSSDANGTIVFKNIEELGGTAPVGTIISMLPSIFQDNALFLRSETVVPSSSPIEIRVGSGVGLYEGWYLCNGKTWTNGLTGIDEISHNVPDLNSFSYTIDDDSTTTDPNSQGSASVLNNNTSIIGGSDIDMVADFQSGTQYDITSSINSTDLNVDNVVGGSTTIIIKRLPQIIYLGVAGLFWSDAGSGQTPDSSVTYLFNETSGTPTFIQNTPTVKIAPLGTATTFDTVINPPAGYEFITVPTFTTPVGFTISSSSIISGSVHLTLSIAAQPANGVTVSITYDFTSNIAVANSTVTYPTQSWYPAMDAINNGYVHETYDLGTDPNSIGSLTTSGTITAATGSLRYIKYRIMADDYFYKFISPSLSTFAISDVSGAGNITEYSVTDVNGDGKIIDYIVRDNNFGSNNPGASSTIYAYISSTASVYTDVVNASLSGQPTNSFSYSFSGSSSPIIASLSGLMRVRSGVSAVLRLRLTSSTYISGGTGSATFNGNTLSGTFPTITTTPSTVTGTPTNVSAVDNVVITMNSSANINTGGGGSFGSGSMSLEYSIDSGSTWWQCGFGGY